MTNDAHKTWDLTAFYTGLDDPQIEKDQAKTDRAIAAFEKKYRKSKAHLRSAKALAKALDEYVALMNLPGSRVAFYVHYRKDLDVADKAAEALGARMEERATKRGNRLIFFTLELGKVTKAQQKKFLAARELGPYRYWLEMLFDNAKYDLTEPEEKILSLKGDVSYGRWVQATENILNAKTVAFDGRDMPLPEAQMLLSNLDTKGRHTLHPLLNDVYKSVADVAESELNAIYTDKRIEDELRGMKQPYEATIRGYQNDVKSVLALVDTVTEHNRIAHRFYDLKRSLLGLTELTYADRAARIGAVTTPVPFEHAYKIVHEEFTALDSQYGDIMERLYEHRQIDVYPKAGKGGGAYCASSVNVPTMVFLNHTDTVESLKTLAHELGHAIHAERAKTQPLHYQGHPISSAETASTFFEAVALKRVIRELPTAERIVALHDAIQDDISTIFRQIACFQFERALHERVRTDGYVPKEQIAELMNEHMAAYLGPTFALTEADGYFFVTWSHIRRFFYVYSYAYGQLISKAMHRKLEKDPSYIKKVDQFLTSGESASPDEIFKACGLNTRRPELFAEGLASVERDIEELEKLVKQEQAA